MLFERKIATVFGGSGFLGRYVVRRLTAAGYIVRVAVRDTEGAKILRPMGDIGQVVLLQASVENEAAAARAIAGADIVFNLTGILAERRKGDFMRIHAEGAGRLARLAKASGVSAFIHISAIRGRCGQSVSLCAQQGGRRGGGARRFSAGGDFASLRDFRR